MHALRILFLILALGGGMTSLAACDTLQDAWEGVRDTVD